MVCLLDALPGEGRRAAAPGSAADLVAVAILALAAVLVVQRVLGLVAIPILQLVLRLVVQAVTRLVAIPVLVLRLIVQAVAGLVAVTRLVAVLILVAGALAFLRALLGLFLLLILVGRRRRGARAGSSAHSGTHSGSRAGTRTGSATTRATTRATTATTAAATATTGGECGSRQRQRCAACKQEGTSCEGLLLFHDLLLWLPDPKVDNCVLGAVTFVYVVQDQQTPRSTRLQPRSLCRISRRPR
jgi:hypothetical protein